MECVAVGFNMQTQFEPIPMAIVGRRQSILVSHVLTMLGFLSIFFLCLLSLAYIHLPSFDLHLQCGILHLELAISRQFSFDFASCNFAIVRNRLYLGVIFHEFIECGIAKTLTKGSSNRLHESPAGYSPLHSINIKPQAQDCRYTQNHSSQFQWISSYTIIIPFEFNEIDKMAKQSKSYVRCRKSSKEYFFFKWIVFFSFISRNNCVMLIQYCTIIQMLELA